MAGLDVSEWGRGDGDWLHCEPASVGQEENNNTICVKSELKSFTMREFSRAEVSIYEQNVRVKDSPCETLSRLSADKLSSSALWAKASEPSTPYSADTPSGRMT